MHVYRTAPYWHLLLYTLCAYTVSACHTEQHIVVIIPSYNNAPWCEKNIDSACMQQYSNFKVIYIDDASDDGTGDKVDSHIRNKGYNNIRVIHNSYNRKALANLYRAIHQCADTDLIVLLDGDDFFADDDVLAYINKMFTQEDIWAAYAQYMNVPIEKAQELKLSIIGYARPTPENMFEQRNFRNNKIWVWSGCRIFYAWLFKLIKFEDLILPVEPYKGKCFPTSYDAAIIWPFLESSGRRVKFIEKILLHRNVDTPLNDFKIHRELQRLCGSVLMSNPQYDQLTHPVIGRLEHMRTAPCDIVICADTSVNQDQLEHIRTHLHGASNLYITRSEHTRQTITASPNNYVLFVDPHTMFRRPVDLTACIELLEKTYAHSFHLSVSLRDFGYPGIPEQKLPCEQLWDEVYAWRFSCAEHIVNNGTHMHNVLYRKQDALTLLNHQNYLTPPRAVGLFYKEAVCN